MILLKKVISAFTFVFVSLFLAYPQISYEKYFDEEVLRIDYYRHGFFLNDTLEIVQFKKEPFWSGHRKKTIPLFDYGNYKIDVYDSLTGAKVFSQGFSSLFYEFIFTEKGRVENEELFEETVRVPFPKKTVELVFSKRNERNLWEQQLTIFFNPKTHSFDKDYPFDKEIDYVRFIHYSGVPEICLDIVFVADAYAEHEKEKFFSDTDKLTSFLLNCSPFSAYKDKINIYAVFTKSFQSGLQPTQYTDRTALQTNFNTFDSERYLMTRNHFDLKDAVSSVPYDNIVVIVNTAYYGGGGIYNFYATCPSNNTDSDFLLIHEMGHSFAGLADEYYTSEVSVISYYNTNVEPWEPNITTLNNFESKWKSLLKADTPIPTPLKMKYSNVTGVFKGAGYQKEGLYRPAYNCTMKSVVYNHFCEVCKLHIEKMIHLYIENTE